ncbi:MAG: DUF6515 family protein [Bryobacteraceae bacterium]
MINRNRRLSLAAVAGALLSLPFVLPRDLNAAPRHEPERRDDVGRRNEANKRRYSPRPVPVRGQVRTYARPGYRVAALPGGYARVNVRGGTFFYSGGVFYTRSARDYMVVRAPIGARVRTLPAGFLRFTIGARPFFFVNDIYFSFDERTSEYVVVDPPMGANAALAGVQQTVGAQLYAYPREGQSPEQARQDRYECHLWAVDETGFDPSAPSGDLSLRTDYDRALGACLDGRGYTVR